MAEKSWKDKNGEQQYRNLCGSCRRPNRVYRTRGGRLVRTGAGFGLIPKIECATCHFNPQRENGHPCQLDIDHIDGNHRNNDPANLQVLCVRCHRLKTWRAREFMAVRYRALECKSDAPPQQTDTKMSSVLPEPIQRIVIAYLIFPPDLQRDIERRGNRGRGHTLHFWESVRLHSIERMWYKNRSNFDFAIWLTFLKRLHQVPMELMLLPHAK